MDRLEHFASVLTERSFFDALAAPLCVTGDGVDRVTLYLKAETSDFIRFNHAAVRQATHVSQGYATLAVVHGARRIESTLSLTGRLDTDLATLLAERSALQAQLADVPDDPYLQLPEAITSRVFISIGASCWRPTRR